MRAALCLVGLLAACSASPAPVVELMPNWRGPAVHLRHLGDRGLEVTLTAPTAGHVFELRQLDRRGERVDLHFVHRQPGSDFVAQVVTPLMQAVSAEQLGDARAVWVWIASALPPAFTPSPECLAIASARL